jgi:FAD:protein FMN transferase
MRSTKIIMGMPICVEVVDNEVTEADLENVFKYFEHVDKAFSPFKEDSEVSLINRSEVKTQDYSFEMNEVIEKAELTKRETGGYFDVYFSGKFNPSGIVKGWAIKNAAKILKDLGFENYFVDAGGDIQTMGLSSLGEPWKVGIRNPFNRFGNVKIVEISGKGIATSGTAIRGNHIYNPHDPSQQGFDIVSLTVIGPDVYEADRFATAAFAMNLGGISFIQSRPELAGYMIDKAGIATYTDNFEAFVWTAS